MPGSQTAISFAFWLAILAAGGLFAGVALSPKLVVWFEYRDRRRANQERLVAMERNVNHLERVAEALERDPEYAAELARVELQASRRGEERIPVPAELALKPGAVRGEGSGRNAARAASATPSDAFAVQSRPVLQRLSGDEALRRWMLISAAGIVLLSFTFLHAPKPQTDDEPDESRGNTVTRSLRRLVKRYRNPA